jgi:hypothetical protein
LSERQQEFEHRFAQQAYATPPQATPSSPDQQMNEDLSQMKPASYRPKIELPKFDGESVSAAKSFVRTGRRLESLYAAPSDQAYLITYASTRFSERAAVWFDRWELQTPRQEQSFARFINDFSTQYIHSKELNEAILNQLLSATQKSTVEQFYDFVSSKSLALAKRPDEEILVRIFTKGLKDDRLRQEVSRSSPETLEAAYKVALRHRLSLGASYQPPRPTPRNAPSAPKAPTTNPPVPRLAKLDDATRNMCLEQKLCFKCRQPGHMASQCPSRNFRPGGVLRR